MVQEVRPSNAEVEDIDLPQDGIVEGIEEPRGVGHLVVGEDTEDVEVSVGSKPEALGGTCDDSSNECTMAEAVFQAFLISPV